MVRNKFISNYGKTKTVIFCLDVTRFFILVIFRTIFCTFSLKKKDLIVQWIFQRKNTINFKNLFIFGKKKNYKFYIEFKD